MKNWYIASTKLSEQDRAEDNLGSQCFEVYNPKLKIAVKNKDKPWRLEPVFPRYLLVRFDPSIESAATINNTYGVGKLVTFGTDIVKIRDEVVQDLKARMANSPMIQPKAKSPDIPKGEKVRITHGPLSGVEAIFEEKDGQKRSFLLVGMLNHKERVVVSNKHFV